jgi:signal transduction histidine kinase
MLEELLTLGIHGSASGMLLLTASIRGDRIYISVSDDMPGADVATLQARARGLAERVALRGGALDLVVRPDEGTTMTLRLAAAVPAPADEPEFAAESDFVLAPSVVVNAAPNWSQPYQ